MLPTTSERRVQRFVRFSLFRADTHFSVRFFDFEIRATFFFGALLSIPDSFIGLPVKLKRFK